MNAKRLRKLLQERCPRIMGLLFSDSPDADAIVKEAQALRHGLNDELTPPPRQYLGARLKADDEAAWAQLETALADAGGNITRAARAMGVPDRTMFSWQQRFPQRFRQAVRQACDEPEA